MGEYRRVNNRIEEGEEKTGERRQEREDRREKTGERI